jgi:membrane protein
VLLALFLTGPLAEAIGDEIGIGDTAQTAFAIAKWPLLVVMVVLVVALLYRFAPNARHAGIRWILPGAAVATVLWLAASAGFSLYVANFGSYGNTYGSIAGIIVFLIWLWITNIAILFGAQFAAELEHTARAAENATPAGDFAPFVSPARDE